MRREGELTSIRRGAYLSGRHPEEPHEGHRYAVRAAAAELCPLAVISHVSAAVLHGLPTWRTPLTRVHATRARTSGGRRNDRVHIHVARLAPEDVTVIDGIVVTALARTVIDVSRTTAVEEGVVVADAALASGLLDRAHLVEAALRVRGRRGAPRALRVAEFADGRAESVGESRSRVALARAGLPAPVPQWAVTDSEGRLIGRSDFGGRSIRWPESSTVGSNTAVCSPRAKIPARSSTGRRCAKTGSGAGYGPWSAGPGPISTTSARPPRPPTSATPSPDSRPTRPLSRPAA